MRILWIAGLGAVLVTGAASAQTMGQGQAGQGAQRGSTTMSERPMSEAQTNSPRSPSGILPAQDPRLAPERMHTRQQFGRGGPVPEAAQSSPNDRSPDNILQRQDPRVDQSRIGEGRGMQEGRAMQPAERRGQETRRQSAASSRENAPRDEASRAYMGGGLILENGRPVPMPGDPPGAASDFRGENVEQSTARAERSSGGQVMVMPGQRGMDPANLVERPQPYNPQTNVGQTGAPGQGASGSAQGAFPANPPTPAGRVPTGN